MDIMTLRSKVTTALGITSLAVLSSDVLRWGPHYLDLRLSGGMFDREQMVPDIYEAIRLGSLENQAIDALALALPSLEAV